MQWTLGRRLKAGLGLLLAGVLILGINSLVRIASLSGQIDQMVDVTVGSMQRAGEIRYLLAELQAGLRQVVIATAKHFIGGILREWGMRVTSEPPEERRKQQASR